MENASLKDIINYLQKNKTFLHEKFGVIRMGIFGSFVREEQSPSSDIDLIIDMEVNKKNIHNFLDLKRFLERETEKKIDLGFEHSLKPIVKEKIRKHIIYV